MCTSITLKHGDSYYGRNLDLEYHFGERVVVTPRNYCFRFRKNDAVYENHLAMIGMATVAGDYPLYAEAANEKGVYVAGLYFPGNAVYSDEILPDKDNITPFELIPWILSYSASLSDVKELLSRINIINVPFSDKMPLAGLHWHMADKEASIVVECTKDGMKVYDDPVGVLTNNPPFDFHLQNIRQYMNLSPNQPQNTFAKDIELTTFGVGMGAIGLPGDNSPASRFVKAAFLKQNAVCAEGEEGSVSEFFHILDAVASVRGSVITAEGKDDITTYSSCINGDKGIYYYKTYDNSRVTAVDMHKEDLDSSELKQYELHTELDILHEN